MQGTMNVKFKVCTQLCCELKWAAADSINSTVDVNVPSSPVVFVIIEHAESGYRKPILYHITHCIWNTVYTQVSPKSYDLALYKFCINMILYGFLSLIPH